MIFPKNKYSTYFDITYTYTTFLDSFSINIFSENIKKIVKHTLDLSVCKKSTMAEMEEFTLFREHK